MDGHRLHHGLPAAHRGAFLSRIGRPSRSIATSVVVPPMSETSTSSSPERCRAPTTLAAGPDRIVSTGRFRASSADQRAVALHHHQRRRDALLPHQPFHRADQMLELRDQPRVQRRGQRAARRVQLRGQFMAAGDRQAGDLADQLPRRQLMGRVAHGKIGATAKDATLGACSRTAARTAPRSSGVCSSPVGLWPPAMNTTGSVPSARPRSARFSALVVADQEQADRAPCPSTSALVASVVESDTRRCRRCRAAGSCGRIALPPVADGEVVLGGQRLRLATPPAPGARGVEQHRVGVGSAGIEAQRIGKSRSENGQPRRFVSALRSGAQHGPTEYPLACLITPPCRIAELHKTGLSARGSPPIMGAPGAGGSGTATDGGFRAHRTASARGAAGLCGAIALFAWPLGRRRWRR